MSEQAVAASSASRSLAHVSPPRSASPDQHGKLEAARMEPDRRAAQRVEVVESDLQFLAGFASARPAPSYLMREVPVTWTPSNAPRCAAQEVPA